MEAPFQPYYAVIFTSIMHPDASKGYAEMAIAMEELAKMQPGYIDFESARNEIGISVSYWQTLEDIQNWKQQSAHLLAQKLGQEQWYKYYKVRVCKVDREYEYKAVIP